MTYVSHIVILHTLNMHSVLCQLYLNKTGGKKCMAAILFETQNPFWSVDVSSILLRCHFDMVAHIFDWLLNFLLETTVYLQKSCEDSTGVFLYTSYLAFHNITNVTLVFIKTKKLCGYSAVNYRLYSHPTSFPPKCFSLHRHQPWSPDGT